MSRPGPRGSVRIGQAAEALGVSVETLRRWEARGTIAVTRTAGGQRLIGAAELSRQLATRRHEQDDRPIAALLGACSTGGTNGTQTGGPITVLAASSLQAALTAAGELYSAGHPGGSVTFGFDASSALRTKIEQGAPADLFVSADVTTAAKLVSDGFAIGPPQPFAGNRLAIVLPRANPAHVATPADLARPGVRLVA